MIVISHRGYWKHADERNSATAFHRSFDLGFGTETDLRDRAGDIVISHDPPTGGEMALDSFLGLLGDRRLPLALNIKADGLARKLAGKFAHSDALKDAFVFDMSVPDAVHYANLGIPFFTRMSEYETEPALLDRATGVWLDAFDETWFGLMDINALLDRGLRVCIVSPELHGRDPAALWRLLLDDKLMLQNERLMICTDRPEEIKRLMEDSR